MNNLLEQVRRRRNQLFDRLSSSRAGEWFRAQSERERRLVIATGAFLLLVLFWLLIWQPAQDRLRVAEQRHSRALDNYQWLQANERQLAALARQQGEQAAGSGQALLGTVSGSARRHDISLNRFTPEGSDALSVSLDNVSFSALVEWLAHLEQEEGISATTVTIDAQQQAGLVRARLVLQ